MRSRPSTAVFLVSTPSRFTGEYHSASVAISHIVSNLGDQRHYGAASPFEHHFYALDVPMAVDELGAFHPAIDPEIILAAAALLFGKRLRSHGLLWSSFGVWSMPDLLNIVPNDYHRLAPYGGAREDNPRVPPVWDELQEFNNLWPQLRSDHAPLRPLLNAVRSYAEALRLLPLDIEVAYFRLIQALESASSNLIVSEEERFVHDAELRGHLTWLDNLADPQGAKSARYFRRRLYQIKRTVSLWLKHMVSDDFFTDDQHALQPSKLDAAISAAYDLRSLYVHTGTTFGVWVDPALGRCGKAETIPPDFASICTASPLSKLIKAAPSFLGLERLVRYSVLKALRLRVAGND